MSMCDVPQEVLDKLRSGPVNATNGTLVIAGYPQAAVDAALIHLADNGRIGAYGAPNMNSEFGCDPEVFYLPQHRGLVQRY